MSLRNGSQHAVPPKVSEPMQLDQIAKVFEECFQDAAVFERSDGTVVEIDLFKKEQQDWVVVAAGVDFDEAYSYFPNNRKRAERAGEPIRILPHGRLSVLIVVRPVAGPCDNSPQLENVTAFAPGRGVPWVQVRDHSYVRCWDIRDPDSRVQSLRWELDIQNSLSDPHEVWLNDWKRHLQRNPAHSPSHLHINAPAFVPNAPTDERIEHSLQELRLCVG